MANSYASSIDLWKSETLKELYLAKNASKRSVPVLSKTGAQAKYWEKQIIQTVSKSNSSTLKYPSYHEVNEIRQNTDAERYKRRQNLAKSIKP